MSKETFTFFRTGLISMDMTTEIVQEYDDIARHRLVCGEHVSEWVSYRMFAHLTIPNVGQWYGSSEYYSGNLPRVFQVINSLEDCNLQDKKVVS